MYDIMHLPGVIELGYTGENDFRPIAFDMRPWLQKMPDGVPSIIHIRPGETASEAYVCATEFENGILTWKPVLGDLGEVEGYGQAQIWMEETLTDGTRRGKSAKFQTFVQGAVNEASSDVPEAQEAWITQMTGLKDATVLAKNAAVAAQTGAETAEENAEAWAVGQRNGVDVVSTDPTYHNNSKYYSGQAAGSATDANTAKGDAVSAKNDAVLAKTAAEAAQDAAQAASLHYPYVDPVTGNWMKWDVSQNAFVDTGVHAKGDTGTVPDIEIGTVTTVEHDVPASVTRRAGSPDEAPIFDFSIPKGETGVPENLYGSTIPMSSSDATKVATAIGGKTDKVASATAGNFAGLDSNGNLTDSGHKHSDYLTSHQDISGKADKVTSATNGNFAALDSNGNLTDSGHKHSDYVTDVSGKLDKTDFFATAMPISDQDSTKVSAALSTINSNIGTVPSGQNLQGEIESLNNNSVSKKTEIPANSNANNYTENGIYTIGAGNSSTISNLATTGASELVVFTSTAYTVQTQYVLGDGSVPIQSYQRYFRNNTWSSWAQLALKSDSSWSNVTLTASQGTITNCICKKNYDSVFVSLEIKGPVTAYQNFISGFPAIAGMYYGEMINSDASVRIRFYIQDNGQWFLRANLASEASIRCSLVAPLNV